MGYFILIKGVVNQEDITILNITHQTQGAKFYKNKQKSSHKTILELKTHINIST